MCVGYRTKVRRYCQTHTKHCRTVPIYENHHARVQASVTDARDANKRMVHTAVPITDESGVNVNRLFICSEKPDERAQPAG